MAKHKKTKLIMSKRTTSHTHNPSSKHVAMKGKRGKGGNKKVMVKC